MRKLIFLALLLSFASGIFSRIVAQTVSIRDTSLTEGDGIDSPDTLLFVVERTDATTSFGVNYVTLDSTAFHYEDDYKQTTGQLFFAQNGPLTDTIKVPVVGDDKTELDELMKVSIFGIFSASAPTMMGDSIAGGTIINNDTSYVKVRDTSLIEGDTGVDSLRFIVDLEGELDVPFSYMVTSIDSTATSPLDFTGVINEPRSGSGTGVGSFFPGLDTITIAVFGDGKTELDEYLKLSLQNLNASGRSLFFRDTIARGTILNDDTTAITIADASIIEGDVGTDTIKFVISLDKMVDSLGISYRTIDSTAVTANMDYVLQIDTIYMNCVLTDTIKIAINGDTNVELDEFFKIDLREIVSPNRTVSFVDSSAIGTIINNDTARITIRDTMLVEGDLGTDTLKFIITSTQAADSIGVVYTTMDSTATGGNDYTITTDTIYLNNTVLDTIKIAVIGNDTVELEEYFKVMLTEILPGSRTVFFADSLAVGAILNDDTAKVSIADITLVEGDTGTDTLKFVVTTNKIVDSLGIIYSTVDSTATVADNDYIAAVADTIYLNNLPEDTIRIAINGDLKVELDQFVKLALTEILPGNRTVCFNDSLAVGTIINEDQATIEIRDTFLTEGDTGLDSICFIISSSAPVDTAFAYDYTTIDSTATTVDTDYVLETGTLNFTGLEDTICIVVNGDNKVELNELIKVNLSNIQAGSRIVAFIDSSAVGTINNDDTAKIAIRDTMLVEGDTGTDTLKFIITSTQATDSIGVVYTTMDSTATSGSDYVSLADTIYLNNILLDTIKIAINGNDTVELNEHLKVMLTEILPGNRAVCFSDSLAVGTIINDDTARVSIRDTFLVEGNAGIDSLKFVVTTDKIVDSLKVVYITFDSTAFLADNDYVGVNDTLCLSGLMDTIKVAVQGDMKVELDEFIKVSLTEIIPNNRAVFYMDSSAVGTIRNDDTARITIRDTMLVEGDAGTSQLQFVVSTDFEVDTMCLVYMTFDSTALVADNDYQMTSDTLWTSGFGDTISITINGDNTVENDEFIKIALKEILPGDRAIFFADSLAVGTIINDDTAFVSIRDTMIIEGDLGTSSLCFIADITNPIDTAFGYAFTTMDSTGTVSDNDYIAAAGNLTFTGLMDTLCVTINGDTKVELDNYLKLMLSNITAGTRPIFFRDSLAVGTIINDDTARVSINDIVLDEGDLSTTTFTFTVTLDSDLDSTLLLDFATCDSTATLADNDYFANTGNLNFVGNANEMQNITVNVIGDGIVEIDEVFTVKLNNILVGGLNVVFADSIGAGSIQNDDFDPTIVDPCECLGNQSDPSVKDGQFAEKVRVSSQSGETWYITSVMGLYQAPFGVFPPAKGGVNYPLTSFATGASGQKLTETSLGTGLSDYTLEGIHVDEVGYIITVTNGTDALTIGNTCTYKKACGADQKITIPFFPEVGGFARLDDCSADNRFINDGEHLYRDAVARYNEMTICPNITGQILTVAFQEFDLAAGDTLLVYDGIDSTSTLIAKGSGNSISQFNGGWVTSNCDPNINATGCLTFAFVTNGDNNKGSGWDAIVNCALQGVTMLNRPDDVFASAKCDSLRTPVNLRMPTISRSSGDCVLTNEEIIVTYCDVRDTLSAGQLTFPVFPFGTYDIEYKLLADTTIKTSNKVNVSAPSLVCNDTIITTIGQGCVTMLSPDDLIENPCDTSGSLINQSYTISVKTDKGILTGSTPNYPILDSGKDGNISCNTLYEVTIIRTLASTKNGCAQSVTNSCTAIVKFIDGIVPVFVEIKNDTIFGCPDMNLTQSMLTEPTVIDNCEIDRLVVTIPANPARNCETGNTIQVTWTAYDVCGNSSVATQNITIQRPNKVEIPRDTTLNCGSSSHPDFTGWPTIDSNGDGIGNIMITDSDAYCNFELIYDDEMIPGTCGSSSNILRIFTLFDDCENVAEPIFIDTQYILLRDTIAPIVFCPATNELGNQVNPYQFRTDYNACTGLPGTITSPTGTDDCDNQLAAIVTGVFRVSDSRLMANNLAFLSPLEVGAYRVAYVLRDDCGNTSEVCDIYFNIVDQTIPTAVCTDELIVSLANGNLVITAEDISSGSFDACGLDTLLVRRTICGSSTDYPAEINEFVANKFGSALDANGWSSSIEIGCCDVNSSIKVQLLVVDKGGNYNKCWLTISPENQPQSVCSDLPDAEGYCDDYATNYIGQSTDSNSNRAYDEEEWQPIDEELLDIINRQFGNPACNAANTVCINSSIEQEYQLLRDVCGVQNMRRRFRTRNPESSAYAWYYQNITINYRPGWSFTFPADTTLQCGTTDVGNIPEMLLAIDRGTCDQIGWEVKDQIFETADGSCFKVLREWSVINGCQHSDVQNPFELPRDQFAGTVTANSKRTFTSDETLFGVPLNTQGYFTYTQVIIVMDNEAPIITIADVDTCIVGVEDVAPLSQADVTPGAAPYECDTLRLFSATGMDCTASTQLNFSYEIYEGATRVGFGQGSSFNYVVQPSRTYNVRFTAADNCGNIGSADRTYTFRDCRRPTVLCQAVGLNLNNTQTAVLGTNDINAYSYDNCTDTSNLDMRIWHPTLGGNAPTNITEVLALPTTVTLDCQSLGSTVANLYVIDAAQNYSLCGADVTLTDNLSVCPAGPRSFIAGRIQTVLGDMVEQVDIQVSGTGTMPEMITTDFSGTFRYEVETGANYTVKPKKTMNPLNGVSTFDLVLIQKHILGLQTFDSPYNYIAADINQSGAVTAFDLVVLRQLILNIITDFPNNESWKFVNMGYPMDTVNPLIEGYEEEHSIAKINKDVTLEFMAVKVGDVNGNAKPNALVASEDRSTNGIIDIQVVDQQVVTGQSYVVDFSVEDINQLEGYQFTLAYDGLTFENWEGGLIDENYFGYTLAKKGFITASWNKQGSDQLQEEEATFKLRFVAQTDGLLSEILTISSAITTAEGYDKMGELLDLELTFEKVAYDDRSFDLYQNRPNPFKEKTEIGFYLPQASKATLTVMDVAGKVVKIIAGDYEKGEHAIMLERSDITTSGLLYYQLETAAGKITKTMLVFD